MTKAAELTERELEMLFHGMENLAAKIDSLKTELKDDISELRIEIAKIKTKNRMWFVFLGVIIGILSMIAAFLTIIP